MPPTHSLNSIRRTLYPRHHPYTLRFPLIRPFTTSPIPLKRSLRSFPAYFIRGGTSNGLVIESHHLPSDRSLWRPILAAAMGSPDRLAARQLDGMGGGASSTSKVCVVRVRRRGEDVGGTDAVDADLDYTFVQVGIRDGELEFDGNCGNMSSGVAAVGVDLIGLEGGRGGGKEVERRVVRIFNTNTRKMIVATVQVNEDGRFDSTGNYAIDGVPGTGSMISLAFENPGGAKTGKTLPTGNVTDMLEWKVGSTIEASLVDVTNPGVFVRAEDVGVPGDIAPAVLEQNTVMMQKLELIRQEGTRMMGLDPKVQSVPKIVIVSKPSVDAARVGINVVCRALSMQQPHKAAPLTLALNLGAACNIAGTIPAQAAVGLPRQDGIVTVAHASGKVDVGSNFKDGQIESVRIQRTARVLMKGDVFYHIET